LQKLNVQSYGVSITTLEEVFLKVAEEASEEYQQRMRELEMKAKDANSKNLEIEEK